MIGSFASTAWYLFVMDNVFGVSRLCRTCTGYKDAALNQLDEQI